MTIARLAALVSSQVSRTRPADGSSPPEGEVDWSEIAAAAATHRLSAIAARAVSSSAEPGTSAGPEPGIVAMREEARRTAASALALLAPLRAVVAALDAAGIPHLLWKGPALAVEAWGDVGARQCDDLDIVIAPADRHRARQVVGALGWRAQHEMSPRQEEAIYRGRGAWELRHAADGVLLELHWSFSALRYPGRLPVAEVLARAVDLSVGGVRVRVPSAADALVLLAQHATKHGWSSLEDAAVFAAMLARDPEAAATAAERARAVGGLRALHLGIALAETTFGVQAPEALREDVRRDPALPRLLREVEARWDAGDVAWRATLAWDLAWTERAADRTRLLLRTLFDPTLQEWLALRLPDPLLPLYRVVRPLRLVGRALRR